MARRVGVGRWSSSTASPACSVSCSARIAVRATASTAVLAALMWVGPDTPRRYADVAENAVYWNFVVGSWVVLFAVVYLTPRLV
jgi:hypothetical protein